MKTLCLIRHAKTSWSLPTVPDRDRPLDERGIQDAGNLGLYLLEHQLKPELILASPANRTRETARIIAEKIDFSLSHIQFQDDIYNASVEDLLGILMHVPNEIHTLILVGHNPGITMLANYLGEAHITTMTTASACALSFEMENWNDLTMAEAKLKFHYDPHLNGHS